MGDFDSNRKLEGFVGDDIYKMPTPEFITYVKEWLKTLI